jgi:peptide/nickel transport system substrate-binding protein
MINYRFLLIFISFCLGCNILQQDKSVIFGIEEFPNGLDPTIHSGIIEVQIYSQIYETLIALDGDYQTLVPKLAQSWSVSDGNTCFTFKLREDVQFHDGSVLRASDVKFSILRKIEKNKSSIVARVVRSVDIIDSLTVIIRLNDPYYQFLYSLTSPLNLVIISEHATRQIGQGFAKNPVGTGPFWLSDWQNGEEIILSSFVHYWQETNEIKHVLFRVYEDNDSREKALEEEEVDILYLVSGYVIDRLRWKGTIEYYVQKPMNTVFIGFNNRNKPFDDIRVRRAVLKALHLPKLVFNVFRGNAILAHGPLPPGLFGYERLSQEEYNIDHAKDLLKEAGYEDGLRIKFYFPMIAFSRRTTVELLESELQKIGIYLDITLFDSWEQHDREIKSDSAQLFIDSYDSDILGDAHYFLYSLFHSKSPINSLHYADSQVDMWLDRACREGDDDARYLLYQKVVEKILSGVPAVFLYHVIPHYAYNRHRIKKLMADPYQNIQFHRIELHE